MLKRIFAGLFLLASGCATPLSDERPFAFDKNVDEGSIITITVPPPDVDHDWDSLRPFGPVGPAPSTLVLPTMRGNDAGGHGRVGVPRSGSFGDSLTISP